MKKIQMVDLISQYTKIQDQIDSKILDVVRSSQYIKGPEVKLFEEELANYLHTNHAIGCANGTDALQVAMMALELKPGDEVITANFTYAATAEVIALLQLKPVLVDVCPHSFGLNVEEVEKAVTPKTKAIVPVHLFGQCTDMEALIPLAEKHNIFIIEDNAQAIGADYIFSDGKKAKAGTIGHIGTTSFFPSKNLGCFGDGGALFTNNNALAKKIRMVANHGQQQTYYHDIIGVNSRLDSIQAGILRIKLQYLDTYISARQKAAAYYDQLFANENNITTPVRMPNSTHVFHQYVIQLAEGIDRDALHNHLKEKGIPSNIYYPVPLNRQKAYTSDTNDRNFPVTYKLCKSVLALPMHTELEKEQQEYIADTIKTFIQSSNLE